MYVKRGLRLRELLAEVGAVARTGAMARTAKIQLCRSPMWLLESALQCYLMVDRASVCLDLCSIVPNSFRAQSKSQS